MGLILCCPVCLSLLAQGVRGRQKREKIYFSIHLQSIANLRFCIESKVSVFSQPHENAEEINCQQFYNQTSIYILSLNMLPYPPWTFGVSKARHKSLGGHQPATYLLILYALELVGSPRSVAPVNYVMPPLDHLLNDHKALFLRFFERETERLK
jgi:hypothetical protein